jgi:hypothetical protein
MNLKQVAGIFLGLSALSHGLLIEDFSNNKTDFIPSLGEWKTGAGYVYTYNDNSSPNNGSSTVTPSNIAKAEAYDTDDNLPLELQLIDDYAYPFAGVGIQFHNSATKVENLSSYNSIILQYSSNQKLRLELHTKGGPTGGEEFFCYLPAGTNITKTCTLTISEGNPVGKFSQPEYVYDDGNEVGTLNLANVQKIQIVYKHDEAPSLPSTASVVLKGLYLNNTNKEWPAPSSSSSVVTDPSSSSQVTPSSSSSQTTASNSSSSQTGTAASSSSTGPISYFGDDDSDGVPNYAEDDDGDGVQNWADAQSPYSKDPNGYYGDKDGNSVPNYVEDDDKDGISNWEDPDSKYYQATTAIGESHKNLAQIQTFTPQTLSLTLSGKGSTQVEIFTLTGQKVQSATKTTQNNLLQFSWQKSLSPGVYLIRIGQSGNQQVLRRQLLTR